MFSSRAARSSSAARWIPFCVIVVARIKVSVSMLSSASCVNTPVGITISVPFSIAVSTCSAVTIPLFTMSVRTATPLSVLASSWASTYNSSMPDFSAWAWMTLRYTSGLVCANLFVFLSSISLVMASCSTWRWYNCPQFSTLAPATALVV